MEQVYYNYNFVDLLVDCTNSKGLAIVDIEGHHEYLSLPGVTIYVLDAWLDNIAILPVKQA